MTARKMPLPDDDWEEAEDTPPESKFIGLPANPMPDKPAYVQVLVMTWDATTPNGDTCPEAEVKFLADWTNHREGSPEPVANGEVKTWTFSQTILKDRIEQLQPKEGDQLKITFDKSSGRAKHFVVSIRRRPSITYAELEGT